MALERTEGAVLFVNLLKAFDKEAFGRMDYLYGSHYSKKEVLSKLLRSCYPAADDTAEALAALATEAGIEAERLVEAAVYAPQWLPLVEEGCGWKGLLSAACFFHAHIGNNQGDESMKASIARFSPSDTESLHAGAFDINWYREVLQEMGTARFDKVCEAARYVSSGIDHGGLRKAMEAVNGREDPKEMRRLIEEKRTKDLLINYCLTPLNKRAKNDLPDRYQYLLQYLKESKAFGSQRQEGEKRAVELGLRNLAQNAAFLSKAHLVWNMEMLHFKRIKPYFTPKEKDDIKVCLKVNDEGLSWIQCTKAGRGVLSNMPNKLRKDPYITELKEANKKLKTPILHSPALLEQAMVEGSAFLFSELVEWRRHPVTGPLLKQIIFLSSEEQTGLITRDGWRTLSGETIDREGAEAIRIAHPTDLLRLHTLDAYQSYLSAKGVTQSFEQVFRPFFLREESEEGEESETEVVHKLPPRRAGWMPTGDGRWQRVYYRPQVVAFLGADGKLSFCHRKTLQPLLPEEVPASIFSETLHGI
jgi:hypothetical protein